MILRTLNAVIKISNTQVPKITKLWYTPQGNKFAMYLIVPYEIEGLSTVSAHIEPEYLSNALKNLTEVTVSLRLPRFKFDSTTILVPFLRQVIIKIC